MNFIRVGQHYINLDNVNYAVRDGKKLVVLFISGESTGGIRNGAWLDLFDSDADEFERKLKNCRS